MTELGPDSFSRSTDVIWRRVWVAKLGDNFKGCDLSVHTNLPVD